MRICVIGGGVVTESEYETARDVGRALARSGHTVVCGGLSGVMGNGQSLM